jgi:hypothetical protein
MEAADFSVYDFPEPRFAPESNPFPQKAPLPTPPATPHVCVSCRKSRWVANFYGMTDYAH